MTTQNGWAKVLKTEYDSINQSFQEKYLEEIDDASLEFYSEGDVEKAYQDLDGVSAWIRIESPMGEWMPEYAIKTREEAIELGMVIPVPEEL